jgi:hypothetical protein
MPPEEVQEALAKFGWGVQIVSRPPDQNLNSASAIRWPSGDKAAAVV